MTTGMIYLFLIALAWLVPIYWVCQYARKEQKNFNIVALVGFLSSWVIALIVALLMPKLSDEEFRKLTAKTEREPMATEGIVLASIGLMTLALVGFIAWMKFSA
jgi:hypothetical protein